MRKLLGRVLLIGVVVALTYALWKRFAAGAAPEPAPSFPPLSAVPELRTVAPPAGREPPAAPAAPAAEPAWVEPDDGACPTSHPVKAKVSSGIFHVPGGLSYDRTNADRCYASPAGAEADGLRPAKR